MATQKCSVCAHPELDTINSFIRQGHVTYGGREFHTASYLTKAINGANKELSPLEGYHVTRHKKNGHVGDIPTGKGVLVQVEGNKLFRPNADGTRREIRRLDVIDALEIIVSVGVDSILSGFTPVRAQDTIEALKKLAEMKRETQAVGEWEQQVEDYLKSEGAKRLPQTIDSEELPKTKQNYLDEVQLQDYQSDIAVPDYEDIYGDHKETDV